MFQNEQFINDFVDEASSHAEKFEIDLLTLESDRNNKELINSLFRGMHSIKGTAGFLGLNKIVTLSHSMENVLGKIKSDEIDVNDNIIEVFLKSIDFLKLMIKQGFKSEKMEIDNHISDLEKINMDDGENREDIKQNLLSIKEIKESDKKINYLEEALKFGKKLYNINLIDDKYRDSVFREIDDLGDLSIFDNGNDKKFYFVTVLEKDMIDLVIEKDKCTIEEVNIQFELKNIKSEDIIELKNTSESKDINSKNKDANESIYNIENNHDSMGGGSSETIRVSVTLLNKLLDMSSEMVLRRNQLLNQLSKYNRTIPELNGLLQNIDYLTTEIQEKVMQTRLQPLNNIFNKLPRLVRELCKSLNKEVDITIKGGEVELDKSIIEALMDPFIHLVRNSIDHGIETSNERLEKGKSKKGELIIKAFHESGFVNIDILDDGKGLSVSKIKNRALSMGYSSDYIENTSEQELIKLIFESGFSTADKITDISGRGVGLNVLKTNIEKLGGSVEVNSTEGLGTKVRLILPLTMAIIPSLIVGIDEYRFVIAKSNLQEIVKLELESIKDLNGSKAIRLRDELIPILYLHDILDVPYKNNKKINIIIVKLKEKRFGIVVDNIYDEEEILVKKLPKYFKNILCYSGVTVLGDGRTAMILDPEGIAIKTQLVFEETENNEQKENKEVTSIKTHLIFNAMGDETYALELKYVARIEKIENDSIQQIGKNYYIQYRNKTIKSIYIEDYLNYDKKESLNKQTYALLLKGFENELAIIIRRVRDTLETNLEIDDSLKARFILGNIIYNKSITIIPDIETIVDSLNFNEVI